MMKIASIVITVVFLCNSTLCAYPELRPPVGQLQTRDRMMQVMQRSTAHKPEPEDVTDSWLREQDDALQGVNDRLRIDHEDDPEFCRLIDETPTRIWTDLPALARHRNGEVDIDVLAFDNPVAARVAVKHELEHARIYRRRGPPLSDDPPTQELADEIIVTYRELEYIAGLSIEERDGYLTYLENNPFINHIAYTNLLTDFLARQEELDGALSDQGRQLIVERITRRIHRHIRGIDNRREEPRFGNVDIRRTEDRKEVIERISRQIYLPLAVDESPKKILLVYLIDGKGKSLDFPTGVYVLKRYLENNYPEECIVEIRDVQLEDSEAIIDFASEYRPDMIGLSLMAESSWRAEQFISDLSSRFSAEERPLLVLGKNTPTFAPQELLEATEARYPGAICVRGEGELAIGGLLEYMQGKRELSDVPNAVYLENGEIRSTPRELLADLRVLGRIDYSDAKEYVEREGHAWMETVRGCPWGHCAFCSTKVYWGENVWRPRPIEIIVEELKELERLGIKRVTFTDEEFFGYGMEGVERARELALAIIESGVKISFYINARADSIYNDDDTPQQRDRRIETLRRLKDAGLKIVYLGLETGSPSQLKRYAKGMSISESEGAIRVCREVVGVEMAIGMLIFEPLVTREEILQTIDFIRRNKILPNLSSPLNALRVYPSIPYYRLLRNKERELGRPLIAEDLDLNSLTFETLGYMHPEVEIIIRLSEAYYRMEYDLYNAIKWFIRFDPRAKEKEFGYLREILEEFKEYQIDLAGQLAALPDMELLRESASRDIFRGAMQKRDELVVRLSQEIEENGHAGPCEGIMRQINIYLDHRVYIEAGGSVAEGTWAYIEGNILNSDPEAALKIEPRLSRLYHAFDRTFNGQDGVIDQIKQGQTRPFARLNLMKFGAEPDEEALGIQLYDSEEEVVLGFLGLTSNPTNWGHLLIAAMAAKYLKLDTVVYHVHGEITYKELPECDRVSAKERHALFQRLIMPCYPLFRYTDLGSEPGNPREGSEEMHRFLEMNKDRKLHIYYLLGVENEARVRNYIRQQYEFAHQYHFGSNPLHRLTVGFIQRGEYGARITQEELEAIGEEIRREFVRDAGLILDEVDVIDLALIKDPDIDLNISSSYYRATQDPAFVPPPVDEHARTHGYYGHPPVGRDGRPIAANLEEYFRMKLEPIARGIAEQVIRLKEQGVETPVITIDGGSGAGKTVIAQEVARYLEEQGYRCARVRDNAGAEIEPCVAADMWLKDRRWRHAVQKMVVGMGEGEVLTEEEIELVGRRIAEEIEPGEPYLDEEIFFDNDGILNFLQEVKAFCHAGRDAQTIYIPDAYNQKTKKREPHRVELVKGDVVIVEGKYANLEILRPFSDIHYRLADDVERTEFRFDLRTRRLSPNDADRQLLFYRAALVPSFEHYAKRTLGGIDYFIDLTGEGGEGEEWKLIRLEGRDGADSAGEAFGKREAIAAKAGFEDYLRTQRPDEFYLSETLEDYRYLSEEDAVEVLIRLKYEVGEYLEVLDEDGVPTRRLKQRSLVHQDGDWHHTVHIIIVNKNGEILRTVRGSKAHSSRGLFDISAAGHVAIGGWRDTAYEEVREELGIYREEIARLDIIGTERGFKKMGGPLETEGLDEEGVYHYHTDYTNREFSTLCIAVIDLDVDEVNERLQAQGELRAVESIHFVKIEEEAEIAKAALHRYTSTFRQHFLTGTCAVIQRLLSQEEQLAEGDTPATPPPYLRGRRNSGQVLDDLRKVGLETAKPDNEIRMLVGEFGELIKEGRLSGYILGLRRRARQRAEQLQDAEPEFVALIDKAIEDITARALSEIFVDKGWESLRINCVISDDEETSSTRDLPAVATLLELGWLRFDRSFSFAEDIPDQTDLRVEFTVVFAEERKFNIVAFPGDVLEDLFDSSDRFIGGSLDEFKERLKPNTILVSVVTDVTDAADEKELRRRAELLKQELGVDELFIVFLKKDETLAIDQFDRLPKEGWMQFYDFSQMIKASEVIYNRQLIRALATAK